MTFGYELEFCGPFLCDLAEFLGVSVKSKTSKINYQNFNLMKEVGITNERLEGGELISPIYTDLQLCLKELKDKLIFLKDNGAYIPLNSSMTGFHIHVGKDILTNQKHYEQLLKFLYAFEYEIYEFASYGKIIRSNFWNNAHPLYFNDIICFLANYPSTTIFSSKKNAFRIARETYELRYFNSSLVYSELESALYFATQLSQYVVSDNFDTERIERYFQNRDYYEKRYNYVRDEFMRRELKL